MKKRLFSLLLALTVVCALSLPALAVSEGDQVTRTMGALDIMVGDNFGNMDLEHSVSRGEFAKLLVACSRYKDAIGGQGAGYSLFADVKSDFWASEYIKLCLDNGWMIGYTDGTFRPWNPVTLEEACTAALRLVGYDSASLAGSFPSAQLNKASAIGLRDDLSAVPGQQLTRGECAQLFYNLLTCRTSQGQVYATTLGYALDDDGKVDYMAQAKDDPAGPFVCEGGAPSLPFTPTSVYQNDRLVAYADWSRGDVYYYNAKLGYVWVYTDRVFGQITALTPSATAPTAVMVDGKSYALGTEAVKQKLSTLGQSAAGSAVTLLLGMDGKVADAQIVLGPYIAQADTVLPLAARSVYRNGELSASEGLKDNDVYYYSTDSATVWIYDKRVSGKIDAVTPNVITPTAVTISGKSYTLGSSALREKLSSLNGQWEGKLVTLLFGMDGSVAQVLTDAAVEAVYYGVVQSSEKRSGDDGLESVVTVTATDGRTHIFTLDTGRTWKTGALVRVDLSAGTVGVSSLSKRSLSGKVDAAGRKIGNLSIAANAEILDTADDGGAVAVEASGLAGITLSDANVRYYALNEAGEVSRLILDEATGETWDYGLMVSVSESKGMGGGSTRYEYYLEGQRRTLAVNGSYNLSAGQAVAVGYKTDGSVRSMQAMSRVKLTRLGVTAAYAGESAYPMADGIQVYLKSGSEYYPSTLSDVSGGAYTLTGYYDSISGKLRVLVAE